MKPRRAHEQITRENQRLRQRNYHQLLCGRCLQSVTDITALWQVASFVGAGTNYRYRPLSRDVGVKEVYRVQVSFSLVNVFVEIGIMTRQSSVS
jgi:hypothetical protein